jgi:hypothetical protein
MAAWKAAAEDLAAERDQLAAALEAAREDAERWRQSGGAE